MPCLILLGIVGGVFLLLLTCNSQQASPPAPAQSTTIRDEQIATAINLSGNLCAKVILISPELPSGEHQVNCEEFRDPANAGTRNNMVVYLVNPDGGTVKRMGRG